MTCYIMSFAVTRRDTEIEKAIQSDAGSHLRKYNPWRHLDTTTTMATLRGRVENLKQAGRVLLARRARQLAAELPDFDNDNNAPNNPDFATPAVCPIDLNGITANQACALPCGHVFHAECIQIWLRQSRLCPTCRTHIHTFDHLWNDETNEPTQWPFEQADHAVTAPDVQDESQPSSPTGSAAGEAGPDALRLMVFHVTFRIELERLLRSAVEKAGSNPDDLMMEHWAGFMEDRIEEHQVAIQRLMEELIGAPDFEEQLIDL